MAFSNNLPVILSCEVAKRDDKYNQRYEIQVAALVDDIYKLDEKISAAINKEIPALISGDVILVAFNELSKFIPITVAL